MARGAVGHFGPHENTSDSEQTNYVQNILGPQSLRGPKIILIPPSPLYCTPGRGDSIVAQLAEVLLTNPPHKIVQKHTFFKN